MFLEQVVGGLVPLLLHLRDPQAPVTSVSLRQGTGSGRDGWAWPGSRMRRLTWTPRRPAGSPCA